MVELAHSFHDSSHRDAPFSSLERKTMFLAGQEINPAEELTSLRERRGVLD